MMRRLFFFAMMMALPFVYMLNAHAVDGPAYPGAVAGEALLRDYMGPPGPREDPFLKGGDILNHQLARGYMDGIKDATEGTAWCYAGGKPHELNDDIAAALMKLKPEERQGRAAPLVVNALRQRFPCPPVRRTP